ncbi:hypothetical protein ATANTOWER_026763 [Ataeniobius toweri]|uniref:Uncharacterized protein n=1 Tax=Ataeniobius toweri TaxID=208326 RepID=A0ABU7BC66_9TELE|nr:hypothetical protein [Ataeniobius toweri]
MGSLRLGNPISGGKEKYLRGENEERKKILLVPRLGRGSGDQQQQQEPQQETRSRTSYGLSWAYSGAKAESGTLPLERDLLRNEGREDLLNRPGPMYSKILRVFVIVAKEKKK